LKPALTAFIVPTAFTLSCSIVFGMEHAKQSACPARDAFASRTRSNQVGSVAVCHPSAAFTLRAVALREACTPATECSLVSRRRSGHAAFPCAPLVAAIRM